MDQTRLAPAGSFCWNSDCPEYAKEETVGEWLQRSAQHVEEIEALLLANYPVNRAQLDALWTYVGHKGEKGGTRKKQPEVVSGGVQGSR